MRKTTLSLMLFLSICIALAIMESKRQDEIRQAKQQATFEAGGVVNTGTLTETSGEYVIQKDSVEFLGSYLIVHHNNGCTYMQKINNNDTKNGQTDTCTEVDATRQNHWNALSE